MEELISCSEILITAQYRAGITGIALVVSAGAVFNILLTPCLNTGSRLNFIHYIYQLCAVTKTETKIPKIEVKDLKGFNRG